MLQGTGTKERVWAGPVGIKGSAATAFTFTQQKYTNEENNFFSFRIHDSQKYSSCWTK